MKTYFDCSTTEQEIFRKAYNFEIEAIENNSTERNPYFEKIQSMGVWEAFNRAIEMAKPLLY